MRRKFFCFVEIGKYPNPTLSKDMHRAELHEVRIAEDLSVPNEDEMGEASQETDRKAALSMSLLRVAWLGRGIGSEVRV